MSNHDVDQQRGEQMLHESSLGNRPNAGLSTKPDAGTQSSLSVERLQMAIHSAGLAWWDQDFSSGQVIRSENWATMLGYSPDEIHPELLAWKRLVHPDDLPRVVETAHHHEEGKTDHFEVEHRMRSSSGDWKWILNWGRVVTRDPQGKPLRALGTHLDITRRKQAELQNLELIRKLETALTEIKTLRGIIPICSHCKKIRDDQGYWKQLEAYISDHSEAEFSHGICPECISRLYPDYLKNP